MTVIVGVKCTDGVVIGADSAATSSAGAMPLMRQETNDKIEIFQDKVMLATTGSVGFKQRLSVHVEAAVKAGVFANFSANEAAANIPHRFFPDLQKTHVQNHPQHGLGFGALIAAVVKNEPCLIEYATTDFQPQIREKQSFFVSMGSGQTLADPFLAFIARVLWKNTLPDVQMGRFGLFWALNHTITLAPGLVGPPIKLATLAKNNAGVWTASAESDTQAAEQFIAELEAKIGTDYIAAVNNAVISAPPQAPA